MKELYISPEVEITCFAPIEGIALSEPNIMLANDDSATSPNIQGTVDANPGQDGEWEVG